MRAVTALLLLLAAPVAAADLKGTVQSILDETIVPAHALLAQAGQALPLAAARDCADPQAIVSAYHALYDRWEYLQFLSFGPVEQFNRGQRLHFWPDRKNVVARQTMQILKNDEIGKIEGPGAVFASVAIQGLPALEVLLYPQAGMPAVSLDAARCRMVKAIAVNLAGITAELAEGWNAAQGHGQAMMAAGLANSPYSDMTAAASRLYNALLGQIEAMLTLKLDRVLAQNAAKARPDRGEAALSQRSLRNLKYNARGLHDSFAPGGKGFAAALDEAGQRALAKKTLAAFEAVEQALSAVPEPLEGAIGKAEGWKKLDLVRRKLKILQQLLTREVGPALGMQFGFNAMDGDGG